MSFMFNLTSSSTKGDVYEMEFHIYIYIYILVRNSSKYVFPATGHTTGDVSTSYTDDRNGSVISE